MINFSDRSLLSYFKIAHFAIANIYDMRYRQVGQNVVNAKPLLFYF